MEAAASVAGLVALADLVIAKGYKYYSTVKEAKHEIRSLIDETVLLHGVLSNLRFALLRLGEYAIEQQFDIEKRRIINWASTANPRAAHQNNLSLRYAGTAEWFADRDEYQTWRNTPNARLWLSGIPGAGKTVMVSSIIESIIDEMEDSDAIAFHYCDFKSKDSQTLDNILCSLIMQVSKQSASAFDILEEVYIKHNPDRSIGSCLGDCGVDLIQILSQVSMPYANLIIVVDGLDECTNRADLAQQLSRLPDIGPNPIKVLLCSRPEPDLENVLSAYDRIEVAASKSDVQLYVALAVEDRIRSKKLRLGRPRPGKPDMKPLIIDNLVEGCKGMFQWAVCQIDYLCQLGTDNERKQALSNLPPGLNGVYQKILERITSNEGGGGSDIEYLLRTLRWLTFSVTPLTLSQLTEAAANIRSAEGFYDEDSILDEDKILELGSSFVRLNHETKILEFSHFTVKDFFIQLENWSQRPPSLDLFRINKFDSHRWLAKFCLRYMMLKNFQEAYLFADDEFAGLYETYPLLKYADYYWDEHARAALPLWDDDLDTLVKDFLRVQNNSYFLRWRKGNLLPDIGNSRPGFWGNGLFIHDGIQLFFAAYSGLLSVTKELVKEEDCVNFIVPHCGTPLSAALLKYHERQIPVELQSDNQLPPISHDYNQIILLLINSGADPNICTEGNEITYPFFTFFEAGKYCPTTAELIFSKLEKQVSMEVVDSLCKNILSGWITNAEVIQLLEFSTAELWDRNCKAKICEALMRNGAAEAEVGHLVDDFRPLALNKNEVPDPDEFFPIRNTLTPEQETDAPRLQKLLSAARAGMSDIVNTIISKYPGIINNRGPDGFTALDCACSFGHETIVSQLLACSRISVNTQAPENDNFSPLHYACISAHYNCVRLLLDAGADVNLQSSHGETPLMSLWQSYDMLSAAAGKTKNLFRISEDLISSNIDFSLKTNDNGTYYHYACFLPEPKYLEAVLNRNRGLDIDSQDIKGYTALHDAAANINSSLVKLLLSHKAAIDPCTDTGATPLMKACQFGNPDSIAILIQAGAQVTVKHKTRGWLPQHYACFSSNPDSLPLLLKAGKASGSQISVGTPTEDGETLLHIAVRNEFPETALKLVEWLLKLPDIDVDSVTTEGYTAFAVAAGMMKRSPEDPDLGQLGLHSPDSPCFRRFQVLRLLLPRTTLPNGFGVTYNAPFFETLQVTCEACWRECLLLFQKHPQIGLEAKITTDEQTPLHSLVSREVSLSRVEFMIRSGANATAIMPDGRTALHMMLGWLDTVNGIKLIKLLCDHGVDVNASCRLGKTALMVAAEKQKVGFIRALLGCGANVAAIDSKGCSALDYGIEIDSDVSVVKVLVEAGAEIEHSTQDRELPPVIKAASLGNTIVLNFLLDQKPIDVSRTVAETGENIWHMLLFSDNSLRIIEILKERKFQASINMKNAAQLTPLNIALDIDCSPDILEALILAGSNVFDEDSYGTTCLEYAIKSRPVSSVNALLKNLPRVDCTMERKVTLEFLRSPGFPLNSQVINLVLEHHENISQEDVFLFAGLKDLDDKAYSLVASFIRQGKVYTGTEFVSDAAGRSAFSIAESCSNFQFCRILEEWKPVKADGNFPSLDIDIYTGGHKSTSSSISGSSGSSGSGAHASYRTLFQRISHAIKFGSFQSQMGEFLSDEDFEIIKNGTGNCRPLVVPDLGVPQIAWFSVTILQVAIHYWDQEVVRILLSNKCLLPIQDGYGWDALFHILNRDASSELEFIANVLEGLESKEDHRGELRNHRLVPASGTADEGVLETALHFLARSGHWRCARILVEKAALFFKIPDELDLPLRGRQRWIQGGTFSIVNLIDSRGDTPIRTAVIHGNLKFIEEMLKLPDPQRPHVDLWGQNGLLSLKCAALEVKGGYAIADTLNAGYPNLKMSGQEFFKPELEVFSCAKSARCLEILLQAGADLSFWDAAEGHVLHHLLFNHMHEALDVVLNHMGPEWAISVLTKSASVYGHALDILGRTGCNPCLEDGLQKFFGPLLPGIPIQCIEDGIETAAYQGYFEFADNLRFIVEQRLDGIE
ncbi:hypothetical protein AOL_s00076g92 [Orbilia oligospora ATCC 24927]|uniref:Nephrocystin 3-like N-terminal domain-containing protein n=1 Tax=Arthrobotrys oligospora (strain ATCC 24927 / CBS 115.81 / DSM 1491) TaxID=756982 RepID=G1X8Y5_ARTOA|nr:hypothetical protein AOL_s00076g92 [Orbilia oligospora ATCC 24927]EGX50328.1 hypothetical protein AOL_s00076g92 [Orbilia oligospora ATCC 24927]